MLEPFDLLDGPIGSVADGAAFWPLTGFVETPAASVIARDWEHSPEGVMEASGLFHEYTHWTQSHSSTFGLFASLLRHRRAEIIECYLRSMKATERARAFADWQGGLPVWSFDFRDAPGRLSGTERQRLSAHWDLLRALDFALVEGRMDVAVELDWREALRVAFLHADGGFPIERIFKSDERRFGAANTTAGGPLPVVGPLSCRALEECAAFLNQRAFYGDADELWIEHPERDAHASRLVDLHDRRWQSYLDSPTSLHVACIEHFCDAHPDLDINDDAACSALLVLVEIALNPPLPPFVDLSPQFPEDGSVKFSGGNLAQTHPVLRFEGLVDALRRVDLPRSGNVFELGPTDYVSFVRRLCAEARLPDPYSYIYALDDPAKSEGTWRGLENSLLGALKRHTLVHHVGAGRVRKVWPGAFAAPGRYIMTKPDFRSFLTRTETIPVFLAPLQIVDGIGHFAGIEERTYYEVLAGASFSIALHSLLGAKRCFRDEGLPRDDMHRAVVIRARKYLSDRLSDA